MTVKLKRYELHQTQAGSHMRPDEHDGEWVKSDDVEKLEAEMAEAVRLLDTVINANSESITPDLYDECVRFMINLDS